MVKGDPGKALTDKQRRFVEEYVVDMNATAAAVRAGYSHRKSGLWTLTMGLPHVKAAVERALAEKRERAAVTAERVLDELARIAFANIGEFMALDETKGLKMELETLLADPAAMAAVDKLEVVFFRDRFGRQSRQIKRISVRLVNKLAALKLLARSLGLDTPAGRARWVEVEFPAIPSLSASA